MWSHLETYLQNFDPQAPLLQDWALDLLGALAELSDGDAGALEARLATAEFMGALFQAPHSRRVSRALSILSAQSFRPVLDVLETLWREDADRDHYPRSLARVIAELDPELATPLFEATIRACSGTDSDADVDSDAPRFKLPQIAAAIKKLPRQPARDLAHAMIGAYQTFARAAGEDTRAPDFIFQLAWQFDHPNAIAFLKDAFTPQDEYGRRRARWRLVPLAFELGDASAEYHLACDRIEKTATIDLIDLAPFYGADTDLAGFDAMMREVGLERYAGVPGWLARFAPQLADRRLAQLLTRLVGDEAFMEGLDKHRQRPYLHALILALLLRAQRRKRPAFSDLTLEAALDMLAAPILLPDKAALMAWITAMAPASVTEPLRGRLLSYGDGRPAGNLLELAGRLGADPLVETLVAIPLGEPSDDACDAAVEQALLASGEIYFDRVVERWEQLSTEQMMRALRVAERALSQSAALVERAKQCVEAHFDHFWRLDREKLLALCPLLGVDCRKRLEPFVSKNQSQVDRTWLTLSLLNGDRSDTVMALLKAHQLAEAEMRELFDPAKAPQAPLDAMPDHIDTELACSGCGESFLYRLERIWINPEEMGDYYPAQEFQCLGCNRLTDFLLSEEGLSAISMHALELNLSPSPSDFEARLEKSPFEILPRVVSYGGERRIGEAIDACRQAILRQPEDPRAFFELGNIYVNLDHRIKARQCFETVIALAPDAIEAYLMLTQMAIDKADYADARAQLERGKRCLARPRLLMGAEVSRDQMVHFYRLLAERLAQPAPDLSDLFAHVEPPVLRGEENESDDP